MRALGTNKKWPGRSLACVAFAIPFLLALVHVPSHIKHETACCETRAEAQQDAEFSNAESFCPICRQLDEFLSQGYVPAPAIVVCEPATIHDTPVPLAPEAPRVSLPDRTGWARPPPA